MVIVAPYLLATFKVHWVKFGDNTDPLRQYGMDFEQVHFDATDATKLEGWFIPSIRNVSDSTVIIAPGRGITKACFLPYAMVLTAYSYNVLLFDLRGQGASSGHTRGFGLLEANDVLGAVRYLRQVHPEASRYIFGLGISHGAPAVITAAARDERIRAVVLDSSIIYSGSLPDRKLSWLSWPINAYIETATQVFTSAILGRNLFRDTIGNDIAEINPRPVLIFHGSADKVADYTQAKRLYALAKYPKKLCIVSGAGHEQVLLYMRNRYIDEISNTFFTGMFE
jgi:alpha-beta hydrolase superfamily lysophospholipase